MPRLRSALVLLVLSALGCGFTATRVRYFEIRPTPGAPLAGPKLPGVLVPDFGCVAAYDQLRVVVRRSPVEVGATRNMQWTTMPGRMLAQGLSVRLENSGRFDSVRHEAKPRPPYTIEGHVLVIELNESPHTARLALRVTVRRSEDGTVIDEASSDETRPVSGRDPADGILVLRELYSQVLDGLTPRIIQAIEQDRGAH